MIEKIVRYENGEMNCSEMIDFFQELIDIDLCWSLQGNYGRTAKALIEEGLCNVKTL